MKININNLEAVFRSSQLSVETAELKGYKLVKRYFVDNSGFGADNEPALTAGQFLEELKEDISKFKGQTYTFIIDVGQFQVYVGLFIKDKNKKSKIIDNNTLELYDDNGKVYAIRLHDTNIITWERDFIILNSGGWHTNTTKARLNKYLPSGVSVYQKNFNWFVKDNRDGTVKKFSDDMKIAI